ncbi:MAG: hypothetical protein QF521_07095 [Alphaproteobacteria bacterium]|jgi:hypothetical protein|nr:hypothetical protein [Alphaproteobacteria bacterium]
MRSNFLWLVGYLLTARLFYWLVDLYGENRVMAWASVAMLTLLTAALYEWFTKPHLNDEGQPISRWRYRLTTVCFVICCGLGAWLYIYILLDAQSGYF